jgi:hypothetical protein
MMPNSKQDFRDILFQILNPVRAHYSTGKALVPLGSTGVTYDARCAEMEGFSRIFWGLVPYFYGGGADEEFLSNLVSGLKNGTDPSSSEYWGGFVNGDQRFCEMAALAAGLILIPDKIWQPLTSEVKDNLVKWLENINTYTIPENNWQFFRVFVNVAFKKLGRPYDAEALANSLAVIDSFYLGNGWYRDGVLNSRDYYIAFAFHFYGLIYSVVMREDDPERSSIFKSRAALFAPQFLYWFGEDGEAVPYGRSLTYRFAESAFWSACLFAGIEPVPMNVMKGILSRHLGKWMDAPIFDNGGILSIGYKYPNLVMAENYNAPGSPMWSLKAFLLLALEDSHPFWSTEPAPMPALQPIAVNMPAEMILCRDSGSATMYPAGSSIVANVLGHMMEKLCKFAYSSKYGFSVQKSIDGLENAAPDSTLIFQLNGFVFARSAVTSTQIQSNTLISTWSPFPGITVTTTIIPEPNRQTRRHIIQSEYACRTYDCGFALPTDADGYTAQTSSNSAVIQSSEGYCGVSGGEGIIIAATPNSNLMRSRTAIPAVAYDIAIGETTIETKVEFE